ncbi:MAG: hypothetical protein DHS80DRAFT_33024 [Piptocephalis tieghemiana]|nr:MAG: hypothetical protein DHS80DRAFT_33024 [Piptocephalis tieghemiana]
MSDLPIVDIVVPVREIDETMTEVNQKDLALFDPTGPIYLHFSKHSPDFTENPGVLHALRFLQSGILPRRFAWRLWRESQDPTISLSPYGGQRSTNGRVGGRGGAGAGGRRRRGRVDAQGKYGSGTDGGTLTDGAGLLANLGSMEVQIPPPRAPTPPSPDDGVRGESGEWDLLLIPHEDRRGSGAKRAREEIEALITRGCRHLEEVQNAWLATKRRVREAEAALGYEFTEERPRRRARHYPG